MLSRGFSSKVLYVSIANARLKGDEQQRRTDRVLGQLDHVLPVYENAAGDGLIGVFIFVGTHLLQWTLEKYRASPCCFTDRIALDVSKLNIFLN